MAKDSTVVDLPLGLIKKSSNGSSGSNGSNGRFSDVYYMIGGKKCRLTINPAPSIQNPTKGDAAGTECTPVIMTKMVLHKDTEFKLCKPNKDGIVTGICGYRQFGKQQITLFYLNNNGEKVTIADVPVAKKAIKQHCSVQEDASSVTDEFADMYIAG